MRSVVLQLRQQMSKRDQDRIRVLEELVRVTAQENADFEQSVLSSIPYHSPPNPIQTNANYASDTDADEYFDALERDAEEEEEEEEEDSEKTITGIRDIPMDDKPEPGLSAPDDDEQDDKTTSSALLSFFSLAKDTQSASSTVTLTALSDEQPIKGPRFELNNFYDSNNGSESAYLVCPESIRNYHGASQRNAYLFLSLVLFAKLCLPVF